VSASLYRQIPNAITVARVIAVAPTAWCLWSGLYLHALILMTLAGASDAVDGWLARRFDWGSRFGAAVDPLADKLLVGALFIVLTLKGHLPLWVAGVAVGRDLVILAGAGVYRVLFGHLEFTPTALSKANTFVQIIVSLFILLGLCRLGRVSELAGVVADPFGIWLVAAFGVVSGVDYVLRWGRRAVTESRAQA
jgi:cardiolipin synthase (CMP-forming)